MDPCPVRDEPPQKRVRPLHCINPQAIHVDCSGATSSRCACAHLKDNHLGKASAQLQGGRPTWQGEGEGADRVPLSNVSTIKQTITKPRPYQGNSAEGPLSKKTPNMFSDVPPFTGGTS
jgi:hypothetical protein